jgi:probable F420-dependent oxidoreductase
VPVQIAFGVALTLRGPLADAALVETVASRAEALGFASFFVTDHIVLPRSMTGSRYPYSASGEYPGGGAQPFLEPLMMLSFLAGRTHRIRLGVSVLVIPCRNPLMTAKMLATCDVIAGGRLILGAGVGWLQEEFDALHAPPFSLRGQVTDEYLELIRRAWTIDPVSFEGRFYQTPAVHVLPKPLQPNGIPIWVGGHTDAAVRRAGLLGDAWHPLGMRPPAVIAPHDYRTKVNQLHSWAERARRDPRSIELTYRAPLAIYPDRGNLPSGERPMFQGCASQVLEDIERYREVGVTHFVFDPLSSDQAGILATMDRFADAVAAKIKPL